MAYLIVAVVAVAVAVFTMQNTQSVTVTFLFWRVLEVPLAAVVLFSLAAGVVIVGVPLWLQRWRLRSRVRSLESPAGGPGDPTSKRA
jgi:uncharacterized integral membrane protein